MGPENKKGMTTLRILLCTLLLVAVAYGTLLPIITQNMMSAPVSFSSTYFHRHHLLIYCFDRFNATKLDNQCTTTGGNVLIPDGSLD